MRLMRSRIIAKIRKYDQVILCHRELLFYLIYKNHMIRVYEYISRTPAIINFGTAAKESYILSNAKL